MKRFLQILALVSLVAVGPLSAQLRIPEIAYDAADILRLPDNIYMGEAVGVRLGVVDGVGVWVRVAVNVGVKLAGTNGVFVAVKVGLGVWVATGVGGGMEGACVGEAATAGLTVGVRRPGARRMAIRPAQ